MQTSVCSTDFTTPSVSPSTKPWILTCLSKIFLLTNGLQIQVVSGMYHLCVCAKLLQLCPILCNPMDCSPLGSSVHGIYQARILERVALPLSTGSSWLGPPGKPYVSSTPPQFDLKTESGWTLISPLRCYDKCYLQWWISMILIMINVIYKGELHSICSIFATH